MEIKNKPEFEKIIKEKITTFIEQLPYHFIINTVINLMLFLIIFIVLSVTILFLKEDIEVINGLEGIGILLIILISIFKVFFKSFQRNLKIIFNMIKGAYKFEIGNHEIDNAIEFIEDFPMMASEVKKLKISLSFGKIIEIMEAARIISKHRGFFDLDPIFKEEIQHTLLEKSPEIAYKEMPLDTYGKDWRFWN